jgi:predicted nuclease with TOPRIM domain
MVTLKQRVDRLEEALIRLSEEMRAFKDEMRAFKDEMLAFKEEMRVFKEEMEAFREEARQERRQMNKQWGELARKMGTLVEDIVSPAARPVIRQYFGCEPTFKARNVFRRMNGQDYEVDVLVVCPHVVFLIEVRSTLKPEAVDELIEKAERFFEFFPEYRDRRLVRILAGLEFPENVLRYATRRRVYAMAYREWEYMDILNFSDIPREESHETPGG